MASKVVCDPQRFPEGTSVGAYPRLSDVFSSALEPVATAKVKNGEAKLSGLKDDAPYWAAANVDGQWRSVAFTPTNTDFSSADHIARRGQGETADQTQREREARAALHKSQVGAQVRAGSAAPGHHTGHQVITGARGAKARKKPSEEPQPFPNQQDVSGVPQRSDTPFGEAHPKDPKELQPRPDQDSVGKRQAQRSSTELGEATPKEKSEVEPSLSQEDVKGKQRSSTEEGSAEPKPRQSAVKEVKERESSKAKAEGQTPAKPKRKTTPSKK